MPLDTIPARTRGLASREPAFVCALALAAGILIGHLALRPPLLWAGAFLALACLAVLARHGRARAAAAVLAFIPVGALLLQAHDSRPQQVPDLARVISAGEATVTGYVLRQVRLSGEAPNRRVTLDVQAEKIAVGGDSHAVNAGVRLSVYEVPERSDADDSGTGASAPLPVLRYGDRLRFTARLREPRNFRNPGAADHRGYLRDHGIAATAATSPRELELLPGAAGTRAGRLRSRLREAILERIATLWRGEQAALIAGIVLGERRALTPETRLDFQRTGLFHILVVSGMNVAILAGFLFALGRLMRAPEVLLVGLTAIAALAYAWLTDAGAPIVRATLMLLLFLAARMWHRTRAPLNALGVAALAILLWTPRALFDASFQLTFAAVAALVGIGVPLLEHTTEPYRRALRHLDSLRYDLLLPPRAAQFRLDLRLVEGRLERLAGSRIARMMTIGVPRSSLALAALLVVSAVMQVALALPMAVYFHRATVVGFAANVLVVPLAAWLLPIALATVLLALLSVKLAHAGAWLAANLLSLVTTVTALLARWRYADVRVPSPPAEVAAFAAAAFVAAVFMAPRSRRHAAGAVAVLTLAATAIAFYPASPELKRGVLELTALDVGQGDALVVVTPEGKTLIMDAGGAPGFLRSEFDIGEAVVSRYLWSRGISRVDAVALSHAHSDHSDGLASVIANFRPRELWLPEGETARNAQALHAAAAAEGTAVRYFNSGESFAWGGAAFEVLAPVPMVRKGRPRANDESLALRVVHGSNAMVLAGDIERRTEEVAAAYLPRADVLKVAHHGSATSTTPEFLAAVAPRYAVISVGHRSVFRHPRPEVLERLEQMNVATFRTDFSGAITFLLDGKNVEVRPATLHPRAIR